MSEAAAAAPVGVTIRRAVADDLAAALELWRELDRLQHDWRVFEPRRDIEGAITASYRRAVTGAGAGAILLVAVDGDEVVGTAYGHAVVPSSFSDERALEVGGVLVRDSHRRRGIATELTRELAAFARREGIGMLVLKTFAHNEEALAAWTAMGFDARMVQLVAPVERFGR